MRGGSGRWELGWEEGWLEGEFRVDAFLFKERK